MKFSLTWLKRYIDIDKSPGEIEEALNLSGLEVEDVETLGLPQLDRSLSGRSLSANSIPMPTASPSAR